jgi:signal transduction histidine kinase
MPSTLRKYVPELALSLFIGVNLVAMMTTRVGQTVPFHFIWISLTIAYGYRTWTKTWTVGAVLAVCVLTSLSLWLAIDHDGLDPAELTEVPLMAAVFVANMMHASRREEALSQVRRYAAEQERQRANERDFLRDASHLLRTPVTIARGFTELLRASSADEAFVADTDVILRELDSMSRISSRLLLLTATELGDLLDCADLDVADLVEQAGVRWQPAAVRSWRVQTEQCEIFGDASLLESALDALIENAVRHTQDGDAISVRCSRHGDDVLIDVSDAGEGIDEDRLPELFERTWRPRTSGERTGSGLGLAIVKAIVSAHGGQVRASNSSAGGAEFTLQLPGAPRLRGRASVDAAKPALLATTAPVRWRP